MTEKDLGLFLQNNFINIDGTFFIVDKMYMTYIVRQKSFSMCVCVVYKFCIPHCILHIYVYMYIWRTCGWPILRDYCNLHCSKPNVIIST